MSKSYEFQGKNIDKALERASEALNIPVDQIQHEVLTYGSTGIFGLVGIKKAKIKVFIEEKKQKQAVKKERPKKETRPTDVKSEKKIEPKENEEATQDSVSQTVIDDEIIEIGKTSLQRIVDSISEGASIDYRKTKDKIIYAINGGDSGVLIGKRGQTLEAIQYLLEKMINKKREQRVRIVVDIEGYIEKRKTNLRQMASRMAEKAKKIKKPVTIGQMNAHDRRIVHIHLKNENGIRTQSIGEGYYRKLMIFPKKAGSSKKR